ncbi:helix-turn-helix transcriptional regulator [Lyngbya confervoides]|uniref:PadR family transcriptional regulator n=1 Tax=Lyngbya confervoides BDU141951 TaxID=1574623 RepID=A0ABD4T0K1_9CYAN|nr:helix-turn-helix transcriptional regulator [Lyngbya confervoides]MCM1981945.1 PadR family transcriptional regulator [Lyngbya confervoides BDU141951]
MLELATLGLLQKEALHGYQLTKMLELFMGSCISVNYGAIYPLLRRLERQGLITTLSSTSERPEASSRIIYRTTAQGHERWRSRMLQTPNESWVNSRARFMIKAFFFAELDPSERIALIQHRLAQCWEREQLLRSKPLPLGPLDVYQSQAVQRGMEMLCDEQQWLQTLLSREQSLMTGPSVTP